jgi:hypothetical protein
MRSRLTALQSELLNAFFARERGFYLTGGAALAGFHLGHRSTSDLDLFTPEPRIAAGERALQEAASAIGGSVEHVQTAPDFVRRLVRRDAESVLVELGAPAVVHHKVPCITPDKPSASTWKLSKPASRGWPKVSIVGAQPSEFTFVVQYVAGGESV